MEPIERPLSSEYAADLRELETSHCEVQFIIENDDTLPFEEKEERLTELRETYVVRRMWLEQGNDSTRKGDLLLRFNGLGRYINEI